jgi:hypothetical protein
MRYNRAQAHSMEQTRNRKQQVRVETENMNECNKMKHKLHNKQTNKGDSGEATMVVVRERDTVFGWGWSWDNQTGRRSLNDLDDFRKSNARTFSRWAQILHCFRTGGALICYSSKSITLIQLIYYTRLIFLQFIKIGTTHPTDMSRNLWAMCEQLAWTFSAPGLMYLAFHAGRRSISNLSSGVLLQVPSAF